MPAEASVIVVGAGAAGIAAARALRAAGCPVEVLEARDRLGGRAVTVPVAGHPLDLGAHWLHMANANPLVPLARAAGVTLKPAPQARPIFASGRQLDSFRRLPYLTAFVAAEWRARRATAKADFALERCFGRGPVARAVGFNMAVYCGAALPEISAYDCMRVEDSANLFAEGGYGALLAREAAGLPVRYGAVLERVTWSDRGVTLGFAGGATRSAGGAILALPHGVLAAGAIAFDPPLPAAAAGAIAALRPAFYEHAVFRWTDHPFRACGADQLVFFRGDPLRNVCMLAAIDGTDLHYMEIGGPLRDTLAGSGAGARAAFVRDFLADEFGRDRAAAIEILHLTDWWNDPFARGSWSVAPPGHALCREALRDARPGRLRFAGEFAAPRQWGTVGGAWESGLWAARDLMAPESAAVPA
jgi:monoamine oxidase